MKLQKRIALVVAAFCITTVLSSCHSVIQPSCADIARANLLLLEAPVHAQIDLDIVSDTVIAYYSTDVSAYQDTASWAGKATVFYNETYFTQECISQADSECAAKQWRGQWAESNCISPLTFLEALIGKIDAEVCFYDVAPVREMVAGEEIEAYTLMLPRTAVPMEAICDASFDSLFGGDLLLQDLGSLDITLLVDTETLLIREIRFLSTGYTWGEGTITIEPAAEAPVVTWDNEPLQDVPLNEEWTISGSLTAHTENTQASN